MHVWLEKQVSDFSIVIMPTTVILFNFYLNINSILGMTIGIF